MTGDKLADYPCPWEEGANADCVEPCVDNIHKKCVVRPIYEEHIALRAAVLGGITPEEAANFYGTLAKLLVARGAGYRAPRIKALAAFVAKL